MYVKKLLFAASLLAYISTCIRKLCLLQMQIHVIYSWHVLIKI